MCRADLAPAVPQVGVGLVSALQLKPCGAQEAGAAWPGPSVRFPHLVEEFDHLIVDDEDDGHIKTHTAQARHCTLVKPARNREGGRGAGSPCSPVPAHPPHQPPPVQSLRQGPFMFHDLVGTVPGVLVLVRFQPLWEGKSRIRDQSQGCIWGIPGERQRTGGVP